MASRSSIREERKRLFIILLAPCIVVSLFVVVFPLVYNLWLSVHKYNLIQPKAAKFVAISNYLRILAQDATFWKSLGTTGIFCFSALAVELVAGMIIAVFLNRDFPGRKLIQLFLMLPMVATPVAVSYVWRIMYNPDFGIVNYLVKRVGLKGWGGVFSARTAMISLVIVDFWQWTPFLSMVFLAGLLSLPAEPIEAARVDGASALQRFLYVVLPLLRPIVSIGVILRGIDLFKTFDIIYSLTAGGPGRLTETLNIYTYHIAFSQFEAGYSSALSIIAVIFASFLVLRMAKLTRLTG